MTANKKLYVKTNILVVCLAGLLSISMAVKGFAEEVNAKNNTLDMSLGNPAAPVNIVDYSSFTCPHCATFHSEVFPKIKEEYVDSGKVFLIFMEFKFSPDISILCGLAHPRSQKEISLSGFQLSLIHISEPTRPY